MNPILIVLPILTILMFDLGLTLQPKDFALVFKSPKACVVGLCGQLLVLPLIAFVLAYSLNLPPYFFIGIVLIACCPGGSSSNIFSLLAKGDVALSVSLTAISSVVTLFTLPVIMQWTTAELGESLGISLPVKNLLLQNCLTMLLPICLGIAVRHFFCNAAKVVERILTKCAFPALMLVVILFYMQHNRTILDNFSILGLSVTFLILLAIGIASLACRAFKLKGIERKTIVIEVGMQNAAQAIAIASSPFIFNNDIIAVPAIIYSLMMNVVLLIYVAIVKNR